MIRLIIICLGLLPIQMMGQFVYFNNAHLNTAVNSQLYSDVIASSEGYSVLSLNANDTAIFTSLTLVSFEGEESFVSPFISEGYILPNYADSYMPLSNGSVFAGGLNIGEFRYVARYDNDLQLSMSVTYPHQDSSALEEFHGLGLVNDDDFTAFGVRFYDSDDDPWMESCRIEVSRIDMDGNIIQQNLIDPDYSDFYRVNQIFELPNGYFILNGTGYSPADNMILLLDENYELLQSHFWGNPELNEGICWSVQEEDPWYFTNTYVYTSFLDEFDRPWTKIHLRRIKNLVMIYFGTLNSPMNIHFLDLQKLSKHQMGDMLF